jgi:hypothetical protein
MPFFAPGDYTLYLSELTRRCRTWAITKKISAPKTNPGTIRCARCNPTLSAKLPSKAGVPLCQIQRANEIAKYGLAEARRSILSLRSGAIEQSGLTSTLQRLVDHSNLAGRLRCDFPDRQHTREKIAPEDTT